jgi:nucleoid-associated protein YgaU
MKLFDQIKDLLTTDDAEKAAKAKEIADQAQKAAQEAAAKAADARRQAEAAEEAREVQAAHDAHVAQEKAKADKAAADHAAAQKVAAAHAAAEKAEHALRSYTVVKGDTLSEIGQRFKVDWRDIAKLNHVKNPDLIYPGQVFKIPHS